MDYELTAEIGTHNISLLSKIRVEMSYVYHDQPLKATGMLSVTAQLV